MQSLNATQYFDYDAIQQEQMNQQIAEGEETGDPETAQAGETEGTDTSEESSSEAE